MTKVTKNQVIEVMKIELSLLTGEFGNIRDIPIIEVPPEHHTVIVTVSLVPNIKCTFIFDEETKCWHLSTDESIWFSFPAFELSKEMSDGFYVQIVRHINESLGG